MAYFEDLTIYTYSSNNSGFEYNPNELNVGWLSKGRPFPVGPVPEPAIARLKKLAEKHQDWEKRAHLNVSRIIDRTIKEIKLVRNPLQNLIICIDDGSILEVFGDEDGEDWYFDGIHCTVRTSGEAINTT